MLIKYATNSKYKDKKNTKQFLASVSHLSLDNKNIAVIDNLTKCPNLSVLYLFENKIQRIEGIQNLSNIV